MFRHKQAQPRTQGPNGSASTLQAAFADINIAKDRSVLFLVRRRIHFNAAKDRPRATMLFLASGLLLMASTLIAGKLFFEHFPSAPKWALAASLALWLAITGANMWMVYPSRLLGRRGAADTGTAIRSTRRRRCWCAGGSFRRAGTESGQNRLEAFSDGVLAIIITIMVLEMKVPHGTTWKRSRRLSRCS